MDFNHFIYSGNVVRDLELRYLPSGTPTVTYLVAHNSVRYEGEERRERTDFVPVTTFGKQAERDARFLRKGSKVFVELRVESWYQKEERRGGFNFVATNVQYGGSRDAVDAPAPKTGDAQTGEGHDEWIREFDGGQPAKGAAIAGAQRPTQAHAAAK